MTNVQAFDADRSSDTDLWSRPLKRIQQQRYRFCWWLRAHSAHWHLQIKREQNHKLFFNNFINKFVFIIFFKTERDWSSPVEVYWSFSPEPWCTLFSPPPSPRQICFRCFQCLLGITVVPRKIYCNYWNRKTRGTYYQVMKKSVHWPRNKSKDPLVVSRRWHSQL